MVRDVRPGIGDVWAPRYHFMPVYLGLLGFFITAGLIWSSGSGAVAAFEDVEFVPGDSTTLAAARHSAWLRHVAARIAMITVGLIAVLVALLTIHQNRPRLGKGYVLGAVTRGVLICGLFAWLFLPQSGSAWLASADGLLTHLAVKAEGTEHAGANWLLAEPDSFRTKLHVIWWVMWTLLIFVGFAMGSTLAPTRRDDAAGLRAAQHRLRLFLYLGAATLVLGVVAYSQLIIRLGLAVAPAHAMTPDSGIPSSAFEDLGGSMTLVIGAGFTSVLVLAYLPAALLLQLRAEDLAREAVEEGKDEENAPTRESFLKDNDLTPSLWAGAARVAVALLPLLSALVKIPLPGA